MADTTKLVTHTPQTRRSNSYTQPYEFSSESVSHKHYRAGLGGGCCHFEDAMALRMIVAWMATVAIVVFVALVVEIISTSHSVTVGDIVTDHPNCSQIGADVLRDGGNAVDAAVAAGLCLSVALPSRAGLGGGGIMLIHQLRTNKTTVLDFQEVSPAELAVQRYQDNPRIAGWGAQAVGVPGLVSGLYHAQLKHGSNTVRVNCCSWADFVLKTINLLDQGFTMEKNWKRSLLSDQISADLKRFLDEEGYSQPGSSYNTEMKKTFDLIFSDPLTHFYNGTLARRLVSDLDGHLSLTDLSSYSVVEREALVTNIGQHAVVTTPAPSAGPELIALLNTAQELVRSYDTEFESSEYFDKLVLALETIHDQQRLLGDPVVDQKLEHDDQYLSVADRQEFLTSPDNVASFISSSSKSRVPSAVSDNYQSGTHVTVMDDKDTYVSMILSLNGEFGSGTFSSGILLNNVMAGFDLSSLTEGGGSSLGSNQLGESQRPLYRGAPVVTINNVATCGTRVVTGSVLSEITAQVLLPVLLSKSSDYNSLIEESKLVLLNNTVQVVSSTNKGSSLSNYAAAKHIQKLSSQAPWRINLLEKTIDTVFGHSQSGSDFKLGHNWWRVSER